jgi:hypothetical protein
MALFGKPTVSEYSESNKVVGGVGQAAEDNAVAARMQLSEDVNRCLDGDLGGFVMEAIKAAYDDKEAVKMIYQSGVSTRINLMRDALNKVDKSWDAGAEYSLQGVEDGGGEVFQRYVERAGLDPVTKECSLAMWVHPGFCAVPMVLEADKDAGEHGGRRRFVTRLFTPDRFCANPEPGAPGVVRSVDLFSFNPHSEFPFERTELTRMRWEKYVRKDVNEKWRKTDEGDHGYGVIPVALARPVPFRLWADNYGAQLLEATIRINAAQTLLTYNSHSQVKFLAGSFQKASASQVVRQGALVDDPTNTAKMMDLQTDLAAFRATHIDGERRMVAALFGFPADEFDGTNVPQSGEALKIRLFAAMQLARKRQEWLIRFVTDLYWVGMQVLSMHMMDTTKPPIEGFEDGFASLPPFKVNAAGVQDQVRLVVKPREIVLPSLASEVAAEEDRELSLGLTNEVKLYMKRNPGVDADEAAAAIATNKRLSASLNRPVSAVPKMRPGVPVAKPATAKVEEVVPNG